MSELSMLEVNGWLVTEREPQSDPALRGLLPEPLGLYRNPDGVVLALTPFEVRDRDPRWALHESVSEYSERERRERL